MVVTIIPEKNRYKMTVESEKFSGVYVVDTLPGCFSRISNIINDNKYKGTVSANVVTAGWDANGSPVHEARELEPANT